MMKEQVFLFSCLDPMTKKELDDYLKEHNY